LLDLFQCTNLQNRLDSTIYGNGDLMTLMRVWVGMHRD